MENATKALLIAAAILIAIILISMGIAVVRQGQEAVQSVDMSEAEILAHNSKFTSYEGTAVSSSQVKVLLGVIQAHNQQAEESETVVVKDAINGSTVTVDTLLSTLNLSKRYTVKCNMEAGIVKYIAITANN